MKTIRQVEISPVFVETLPDVEQMEEAKIYISKKYHCSGHRCLCGCGELTILPFNLIINGQYRGWNLIEHDNGKISFTPSVGNFQIPCKSHYIITKNKANFV
jgi:hypothetical protein